MLEAATAVVTV